MVEFYRKKYQLTPTEALAKHDEPLPQSYLDQLLEGPPENVTWYGLEDLARHDPDLAAAWTRSGKRPARNCGAATGRP
jgi:hypothetical protein